MANAFIVRRIADNHYAQKKHLITFISDRNSAFVFRRKCDASQVMNKRGLDRTKFDIVPLVEEAKQEKEGTGLVPAPKEFNDPNLHYKVCQAREGQFYGWQDIVLSTKRAAELCRNQLAKKYKVHPDYILVKETYRPITTENGESFYLRPNWTDYLLGMAKIVSKKSHDAQTQHGCVIVDKENRILGTGYNGFPRGLDDSVLPNVRPAKYDWMIHAEINAIANCIHKPVDCIAYTVGEPCNPCLMTLWQNGIKKIVCGSKYCWQKDSPETRKIFDKFLQLSKIEITYVEPDYSWLHALSDELKKGGK